MGISKSLPIKKVGLFGTCAESSYREELLKTSSFKNINFFDPRTEKWDNEAKQNEIIQREISDLMVYAITPSLQGFFTFFESIEDALLKRPESTVFLFLKTEIDLDGELKEFNRKQWNSLLEGAKLLERYNIPVFETIEDLSNYIENF